MAAAGMRASFVERRAVRRPEVPKIRSDDAAAAETADWARTDRAEAADAAEEREEAGEREVFVDPVTPAESSETTDAESAEATDSADESCESRGTELDAVLDAAEDVALDEVGRMRAVAPPELLRICSKGELFAGDDVASGADDETEEAIDEAKVGSGETELESMDDGMMMMIAVKDVVWKRSSEVEALEEGTGSRAEVSKVLEAYATP